MDMTMINLGDPDGPGAEVQVGDDAILFGPGGETASELAHYCGTIHYEILTGVQKRAHRVYVEEAAPARETATLQRQLSRRGSVVAGLLHEDQDAH